MAAIDLSQIVTAADKQRQARNRRRLDLEAAVQHRIDAEARARGYRDGVALASYAGSGVGRWAAEAAAFVRWRDAVWLRAHAILDGITASEEEPAAIDQLVSGLPAIVWPD